MDMKLLRTGSTGPSVQLLQLALNRAGYGELEKDGVFGPRTREALRRFQAMNGLEADGMAGSLTHRTLLPWYTGYFVHTVRRGDTLWELARRYGTTLASVELANPSVRAENLTVGSQLVIPLPFEVVPTDIDYGSALVGYCVRGLAARYPFIVTGEAGKSVMGRPLWTLRLGSGENRVLYNASHHANEWITTPLLLRFAERLAAAFAQGGEIAGQSAAAVMNYASIFLVPAVNPDGIDLVTGELTGGEFYNAALRIAGDYPQYAFPKGWKANLRGVDLNLQYPAGWEQAKENKLLLGVSSPAPADFVGTAPLRAPESRAMAELTRTLSPALTLSYHTQGEVIYWRYGDRDAPNARAIVRALSEVSGYAPEDTPFASAFAGYKDWFVQDFDRPGFTIEAGRGTNPLPITDFERIYRANEGLMTLAAMVT